MLSCFLLMSVPNGASFCLFTFLRVTTFFFYVPHNWTGGTAEGFDHPIHQPSRTGMWRMLILFYCTSACLCVHTHVVGSTLGLTRECVAWTYDCVHISLFIFCCLFVSVSQDKRGRRRYRDSVHWGAVAKVRFKQWCHFNLFIEFSCWDESEILSARVHLFCIFIFCLYVIWLFSGRFDFHKQELNRSQKDCRSKWTTMQRSITIQVYFECFHFNLLVHNTLTVYIGACSCNSSPDFYTFPLLKLSTHLLLPINYCFFYQEMRKGPFTPEEDNLVLQRVAEWGDKGQVHVLFYFRSVFVSFPALLF